MPCARRGGREAFAKLFAERRARIVDFAAWKKIGAAGTAATGRAPRAKLTRVEDMLKALDG
ncbi:MAG TPA: hypothetical protein VM325_06065 [Alphaproteobacteria bacterium]|nr:hypothetical protein [Alphaproteobacteria bacterium]HUW79259.1 hypothetical protein [Acidocella sp.]